MLQNSVLWGTLRGGFAEAKRNSLRLGHDTTVAASEREAAHPPATASRRRLQQQRSRRSHELASGPDDQTLAKARGP
jgi:hypothetical protein